MAKERDFDFAERMSEHEALMWNIEKDPWLNPNGAAVYFLDQPVDMDAFRRQVRFGISKIPRLYQRVVPGFGRVSTPAWVPDAEFDFDYHVREVQLPAPGTRRQLFELATQLYEEPLDRTRPLWRFVAIRGVEGGAGALWTLVHHAISDGTGQMRMAELYQQLERDAPLPPEVDLDEIIAGALAAAGTKETGGDIGTSLISTAARSVGHLIRRQAGITRRVAGEVALWPADPDRAVDKAGGVVSTARSAVGQLSGSNKEVAGGSPLWANRSRHRHLEHVGVSVDGLKSASKKLGGSVNDGFMLGLIEAARRYHEERGVEVEAFNTSFVVSTRKDNKVGGNSFTPVLVQIPGHNIPFPERMHEIREILTTARLASEEGGGISGMSGVINLLPTSVVTRTARSQAAKIDFATSNLRGAPFELFCARAKVEGLISMGPVAGTAANITALSYNGRFDIGIFLDPSATDDPAAFQRAVESSFADLLALGDEVKPATVKKVRKKRAVATKSRPTKATAKKRTVKKTAKKATAKKATAKKRTAKKTVKKAAAKKATAGPRSS